jgi:hypothetical protein
MHSHNLVMGLLGIGLAAGCGLQNSDPKSTGAKMQLDDGIGGLISEVAGAPVDVLPDFRPLWASDSLQDMRIDTARSNDRLVSCTDWTAIDPTDITGQRVISFRLGSSNLGAGHFRTRRQLGADGWDFYQTTSQITGTQCSSTETYVGTVPMGQAGRWLPLGSFQTGASARKLFAK